MIISANKERIGVYAVWLQVFLKYSKQVSDEY